MKYQDIKAKSEGELQKELVRLREELNQLRIKIRLSQAKQNHQVSGLRKDIARILTALRAS